MSQRTASILVVENNPHWEPGLYGLRVYKCPACDGEGGLVLSTHKESCGRCDGTGRLAYVDSWQKGTGQEAVPLSVPVDLIDNLLRAIAMECNHLLDVGATDRANKVNAIRESLKEYRRHVQATS